MSRQWCRCKLWPGQPCSQDCCEGKSSASLPDPTVDPESLVGEPQKALCTTCCAVLVVNPNLFTVHAPPSEQSEALAMSTREVDEPADDRAGALASPGAEKRPAAEQTGDLAMSTSEVDPTVEDGGAGAFASPPAEKPPAVGTVDSSRAAARTADGHRGGDE